MVSENRITHNLDYGVVFPAKAKAEALGLQVKGLRGIEKDPKQENTSFYAGFTAPYLTIAGAKTEELTVTSYDIPKEVYEACLGWEDVNGFMVDGGSFDAFAFAFAQEVTTESGHGYSATYYPAVRATTPADSAKTDEDKPEAVEYEFKATVNSDTTFKLGDKLRTSVKFEVTDEELKAGTTAQAKVFKKLFTELKKPELADFEPATGGGTK